MKNHISHSKLRIAFFAMSLVLAGCSETQETELTWEKAPAEIEVL